MTKQRINRIKRKDSSSFKRERRNRSISKMVQNKLFCKICYDAQKSEAVYTSHRPRSGYGTTATTTCPTLLSITCLNCNEKGHTTSYCTKPRQPHIRVNPKRAPYYTIRPYIPTPVIAEERNIVMDDIKTKCDESQCCDSKSKKIKSYNNLDKLFADVIKGNLQQMKKQMDFLAALTKKEQVKVDKADSDKAEVDNIESVYTEEDEYEFNQLTEKNDIKTLSWADIMCQDEELKGISVIS